MSQSDMLFRVIALLQAIPREPNKRSTTTLARFLEEDGFSVTPRMLQRDLEKLSQYFPINCDTSEKPYRWCYDSNFKSSLPALDAATALSWVLAEDHLKPLMPSIAFDKLQSNFQQARTFLDGQSHNKFQSWRHRVKALPNGKALIPAEIDEQTWRLVTEALLYSRQLNAIYLSREQKTETTMVLHPIALVVRHNTTYLLAMINDYEDIRHLALHRFKGVTLIDIPAREKSDFDLETYIQTNAFGYPITTDQVKLEALIDKEVAWHLEETPLSECQTLEPTSDENRLRLTAQVPFDKQTLWWLLGFGSKVEVLAPQAWRQSIFDHANQIVQRGLTTE